MKKSPLWLRAVIFLVIAIAPGIDCNANQLEPGKAALEVLYAGDQPANVCEAIKRIISHATDLDKGNKFHLVEKVVKDGRVTYIEAETPEVISSSPQNQDAP